MVLFTYAVDIIKKLSMVEWKSDLSDKFEHYIECSGEGLTPMGS